MEKYWYTPKTAQQVKIIIITF